MENKKLNDIVIQRVTQCLHEDILKKTIYMRVQMEANAADSLRNR